MLAALSVAAAIPLVWNPSVPPPAAERAVLPPSDALPEPMTSAPEPIRVTLSRTHERRAYPRRQLAWEQRMERRSLAQPQASTPMDTPH